MSTQPDWQKQFSTYAEYAKWYTQYYYSGHNVTNTATNQAPNTTSTTQTTTTPSSVSAGQQTYQYGYATTPQQVQHAYTTANNPSSAGAQTNTTPAFKSAGAQSTSYQYGGAHQSQHAYTTKANLNAISGTTSSYYTTPAVAPANSYQYGYNSTPHYLQSGYATVSTATAQPTKVNENAVSAFAAGYTTAMSPMTTTNGSSRVYSQYKPAVHIAPLGSAAPPPPRGVPIKPSTLPNQPVYSTPTTAVYSGVNMINQSEFWGVSQYW